MKSNPLRTSVIGSYSFPAWLEFATSHLDRFGSADRAEAQDDAVITALHDQLAAGLNVITDGEQTRLDFNLSFYGYIKGIDLITCSHNHTDHLDAETLLPLFAANPHAKLVIPRANRGFVLERLRAVEDRLFVD
jgi:methionine synthase II (cobalamin-independent)